MVVTNYLIKYKLMYKLNYNFLSKMTRLETFIYILLALIMIIFFFNTSFSYAAEQAMSGLQNSGTIQSTGSNNQMQADLRNSLESKAESTAKEAALELDDNDNELHESNITTKIYRSSDNSSEALEETGSGLDPTVDADILNKEDLIDTHSKFKKKIIHRKVVKNERPLNESSNNFWLPWILFSIILLVLFVLMKIIKQIRI